MKKLLLIAGIMTTLLGACIKSTIPIPPPAPSGGATGSSDTSGASGTLPTWPMGISGVLNGVYTTFNTNMTLDTTGAPASGVSIISWGDSAAYHNAQLAFGFGSNTGPIVPALYPNNATTIRFWSPYNSNIAFTSFIDTITVTYVSDSTFAGTISGTFLGEIQSEFPPYNYDSTLNFTDIKFYLKW
jgi:hypothetical protein